MDKLTRAIRDLVKEGILGACLTGLMVLLFLRDLRSVFIVVLNIPIALASAVIIDAFIVRHRSSGAPQMITRWTDASVVNAGDGWHQHPTQALLDCYTIRTGLDRRDGFDGLHIAIVGDIKHSRVARSDVQAFTALGARVTLVAPRTLLPPSLDGWPVEVSHDLDAVLPSLDVLYLLRVQRERMDEALLPSLEEYSATFGLTPLRAARLAPHALVMHPGPMNRGVEMVVDPAELPGKVLLEALSVFEKTKSPGEIWHLPFTWPEEPKKTDWQPPEMSPLIKHYLEEIKAASTSSVRACLSRSAARVRMA